MEQLEIFAKTRDFGRYKNNIFHTEEHDRGQFFAKDIQRDVVWTIDYYDNDYRHRSKDPCDLSKTKRVITVMLV